MPSAYVMSRKGAMSNEDPLEEGRQAMLQMRFEDAANAFTRLLQQDPSNVEAIYYKAQAIANLGQFEAAVDLYDQALEAAREEANRADILVSKGNAWIELGDLDIADRCYEDALRIKPRVSRIWVERARVAARKQDFHGCVAHCDQAISLDSSDPRAWNNKAFALLQLDQVDDCIECAERALALKPSYTAAWVWLSQAHERRGDMPRARECQAEALRYGQAGMMEETRGHMPVAKRGKKRPWQFWK